MVLFIVVHTKINDMNKKRDDIELKDYPMALKIDKISLDINLYLDKTLDEGLEIHEVSFRDNGPMVISGHSGIGPNALFNDLFYLDIRDKIILVKDGYQYTYELFQITSFTKGSKIQINASFDYLYLVTCDLFNMQKQWIFSSKIAKIDKI
ncbi:MAG: sortase [Firmicutes bacterium]|nr:sortase [Bacillota bacterium]